MFRSNDFPLGKVLWWTIGFAIVGIATTIVAAGWVVGYAISWLM